MSGSAPPKHRRIADNRQAFCDGIAGLIDATSDSDFPKYLGDFLKSWMPISALTMFEFRRGLQPRPIHADTGGGFDDDLRKYLGGLYLLDPMFDFYENRGQTGIIHLSRDNWDHMEAAEYYQSYFRFLGAKNEVGGLYEIDTDTCIHVSVSFQDDAPGQIERVIRLMQEQEALVRSLFKMHFGPQQSFQSIERDPRRHLHLEVSRTMRDFGRETLTDREQDIAKLLLRGHSAKSIARILEISPGTASIHRSNIYQKMGVGGQGELFSNFLERLTGT